MINWSLNLKDLEKKQWNFWVVGALKTARPPRGSASSHGFQSVAAQKLMRKMKFKMNGVIRESPVKNLLLILLSILLWVCSGHSTRVPNLGKSNSCFPSSLSASMACKGFTWLAMVCMTRHNGITYCFETSTWPKRNTSNKPHKNSFSAAWNLASGSTSRGLSGASFTSFACASIPSGAPGAPGAPVDIFAKRHNVALPDSPSDFRGLEVRKL